MPTLKQINCSIELGSSNAKLKEYGARYSDGAVETFIAVPDIKMPFYIHLETKGYIAPGLAAFVFMDGQYQCNRNRLGLKLPVDGGDPSQYEIDFYMRQKEEKGADGRFVGREWTFAQLNTTTADKAATLNPNFLQNLGTIEVVILRLQSEGKYVNTPQPSRSKKHLNAAATPSRARSAAPPATKQKSATPAGSFAGGMFGLFDGANDVPEDEATLEPIICFDGTSDVPDYTQKEKGTSPAGWTGAFPEPEKTFEIYRADLNGQPSEFGARGGHRDDMTSVYVPSHPIEVESDSGYQGPTTAEMEAQNRAPLPSRFPSRASSYTYEEDDEGVGQLDGGQGRPFFGQHQYAGRAVNDMVGDKYLGLTGDQRVNYKNKLRWQGYQVSESAVRPQQEGDVMFRDGVFNHQPAEFNRQFGGFNRRPADLVPQSTDFNRLPTDFNRQPVPDFNRHYGGFNRHPADLHPQPIAYQNPYGPTMANEMPGGQLYGQPQQAPVVDDVVAGYRTQPKEILLESIPRPKISIDVQGNVTIDGAIILAGEVEDSKARMMKDFNRLSDRRSALSKTFSKLPEGHPDEGPLRLEADQLWVASIRMKWAYNGLIEKLNAFQRDTAAKAGEANTGGGGDLTAKLRAQQDAQQQRKTQATGQADAGGNGFQQVGEGVVGGAVPYDQTRQQSEPEQKSASKTGDNNGGWGRSSKKSERAGSGWGGGQQDQKNEENGNGWGGGQQGNNGGWGESGNGWGGGQQNNNGGWGGEAQNGGWDAVSTHSNNDGGGGWGDHAQRTPSRASASQAGRYDPATPTPESKAKPHWQAWKQAASPSPSTDPNTKKKREEARQVYQYPAPQLPSIPEGKIKEVSHVVQPGMGADYSHRCHRPNYMDDMTAPYAVFSFKYRSKTALEKILKRDVAADTDALAARAEKENLLSMPRDRLVEELMRLKGPQESGGLRTIDEKDKSAHGGWANGSNKAASATGGWGGGAAAGGWGAGSQKAASVAGGWNDGSNSVKDGGNDGWGTQSNKGGAKKSVSNDNGWGHDKKKSASVGGWNQNTPNANAGADWGKVTQDVDRGGDRRPTQSNHATGHKTSVEHGPTPNDTASAHTPPSPVVAKKKVKKPVEGYTKAESLIYNEMIQKVKDNFVIPAQPAAVVSKEEVKKPTKGHSQSRVAHEEKRQKAKANVARMHAAAAALEAETKRPTGVYCYEDEVRKMKEDVARKQAAPVVHKEEVKKPTKGRSQSQIAHEEERQRAKATVARMHAAAAALEEQSKKFKPTQVYCYEEEVQKMNDGSARKMKAEKANQGHAQPEPAARKEEVKKVNLPKGQLTHVVHLTAGQEDHHASMATGYTEFENDHGFDGDEEFLKGAGAPGYGDGAGAGVQVKGQTAATPGRGYGGQTGSGGQGGIAGQGGMLPAGGNGVGAGQGYGAGTGGVPEMPNLYNADGSFKPVQEVLAEMGLGGAAGVEQGQGYGVNQVPALTPGTPSFLATLEQLKQRQAQLLASIGMGGAAGAGQGQGYGAYQAPTAGMPGGAAGGQTPGMSSGDPMKKWEDGDMANERENW
ncbi:hypothetical protein LTR35_004615 [Friedmanniomyces endolithicus]|nr:hypothetical protein LTR35_004615 [Friedmanniomyces endolithicus]KAK0299082.1 hypothetical protein LTS00_002192 [Friedmanniomyces endolithicus]KAK1016996.1 hypothetical protein LTR54_003037 [Friedmanniomyces endolithicus]